MIQLGSTAQFNLIAGNRLDLLAAFLGERLARASSDDVLTPDMVLIPQPTLKRWLQQALALQHGIAANIDFVTPSEWVWRMLRADRPGLPTHSPWERDRLRWRLYDLLNKPRLPSAVVEHLQRATGDGALARYRLADALAGAFDKYQAYRRDWLLRWERGEDADDWQAELWRRLQISSEGVPHRAALIEDWLQRYGNQPSGLFTPPGLSGRLAAFGTIHVSPDVLRMLGTAAQSIALDFYLPTPCAEYWGDVESLRSRLRRDGPDALAVALADAQQDNPLLSAWGAAGRDISAQLFSYESVTPAEEIDLSVAPAGRSLLQQLQTDVLWRRAPAPIQIEATDLSIQVHACHSKLREVEVLHDRLRALLDADDTLLPRDIAVLAPDIGEYLPLVRAVFGGIAAHDARYIPYSFSDRPQAQSHPLVGVFFTLLALPQSRFTATELLDLLSVPTVQAALGLDASAMERIGVWFDRSGMRWGEDETARERAGVGRWREHSLAFGLDRLLLGYASGDSELVADVAAYPDLEGHDAEGLDRVLSVFVRLRALAAWMRQQHFAQDWQQRLSQEFAALLAPHPQDDLEAQARRTVLDALDEFAAAAAIAGELTADVVQTALREQLAQASPHQAFLAGGVTFAGMVPLRTVPFRAICLLGLDDTAYPRRDFGGDINRLIDASQGRGSRRLGDRSVRDDDRFLFLQLLCAATDVFYLSYGGRDARDGSVRAPSALVSELLDVAQRYLQTGDDAHQRFRIDHPLQPFSSQAFGAGDARRFSYRREWQPSHLRQELQAEPPFLASALPEIENETPDRETLQRFFTNPARAFLQDRLGMRFAESRSSHDREPLGADGLTRYQAIEALLEAPQLSTNALRARGLLSPGGEGDALALHAVEVATQINDLRNAARNQGAVGVVENREGVVFRFDDVVDAARVIATPGKLNGKRYLRAGIDHLLLASQLGAAARTTLIGFDAKANEGAGMAMQHVYGAIDAEHAHAALEKLVALWREGHTAPLPFLPDCGFAYMQSRQKRDDQAAWKAAGEVFAPFSFGGECDDPWLRLSLRPDALFGAFDVTHAVRFRSLAREIFCAVMPEWAT